MKKPCLLDSSFVIDLFNEFASGVAGPACEWVHKNPGVELWISAVTYAEVLEGAEDKEVTRKLLQRYRWQGIHRSHAEVVARFQQRSKHRMGENDAWQAAITLQMKGFLVGHDPKAFARLGEAYCDHRA
jgi:predicted nucleic acid-binding protein